ncbi:hypothetical protein [Bradyrhizobium sp. WSM3983]|uniref:hypothetical protein n=1 Tax=Bradyrhizobium sp. WSM3983 TaxID=1038867 RepID=UPI0003FDE3C2|nr:hypothetical protein [Bradyrhizobium sp. WSM3983]
MSDIEPQLEPADDEGLITANDAIMAGHCATGVYRWFKEHGFDARKAMREGVKLSEVRAVNDAFGNQVIERTLARRGGN